MNHIGTADNEKLIDLYNHLKNGLLELRPSFQRRLVWNDKHKERFLETILKGFPFPEIYLADGEIDLENQLSKRLVVDGQQRLHTIYSYINGDIDTTQIPRFDNLSTEQKTQFYDYKIVVRDLGRLEEEQIIDIFKRINSISYALNAMEINNALYEGEFISTAQKIQETPEFKDLNIFSENQYARMKDTEYVLLIMATLEEGGYFAGNSEIENHIKLYDNEYSNSERMMEEIVSTCTIIQNQSLELDSLWYRKTSFFTLIVELIKAQRRGINLDKISLKKILEDLEDNIISNKSNDPNLNKYSKFYKYIFQGTNSRTARIARGILLHEKIEATVPAPQAG